MPPTPIMCWFLESGGTLNRFSQSIVLQVPANLERQHLVSALQTILDHHDALRLRFTGAERRRKNGNWRSEAQGAVRAESCLYAIDIAGLDDNARGQKIAEEAQGCRETALC